MPAIDYDGIGEQIKSVLEAFPGLEGIPVYLEEEFGFGVGDAGGGIWVYLQGRNLADGQPLAAGTRTRMNILHTLWCAGFNMESIREAGRIRDRIIGQVEIALMGNRTLNNTVRTLWLGGGDFISARNTGNGSYMSAGEVNMVCEATASTD